MCIVSFGAQYILLVTESVLDGLAVDHVNRLLYYTDTGLNKVKVISLTKTSLQKTVIEEDLDEPRAITVHPRLG